MIFVDFITDKIKRIRYMPIILFLCLFTETEIGVFQAANDPNKTLEECSYPE